LNSPRHTEHRPEDRRARRLISRIAAAAAAGLLFAASLQDGFAAAWLSGYSYNAAAALASKPAVPAGQAGKPSAGKTGTPAPAQEQESVQKPKPAPQALSKRVTEYHIDVALRPEDRSLLGKTTVTWTNPGSRPVGTLYFHLYPNAFNGPETTFMKESDGRLRNDKATPNSVGHMKLISLQTTSGESLLPRLRYVQPDDGNASDKTLAMLRLPSAVPPGGSITLRLGFETKLPEVFARMGYSGNFVMAGQWFPKLAVYEPSGTRGRSAEGWNLHQYHGNSEFYSDFGIYTVRIQVPANYKVAATGFPVRSSRTSGGVKTYQFYADDVHDFAWAASPDFIVAEEPYSAPGVPGVRIKLYLDPLHAKLKDRYLHAAKSALAKYAEWYGEYPYTTLSIVVPPKGANGAGGMEYPTLVTAFAAETRSPGYSLERTIVHEIGHQYWYGMVASNEFEEAWLDEGLTSYAEDKVMETQYGLEPNLPVEASYMTAPAPLKQLSWSYRSHDHYAENVYLRAKLVLVGIERQVGPAAMRKILRTYFQTYRFKHPSTADFQRTVEKVTRTSWRDYFNRYVYGAETADYEVERIQVTKLDKKLGSLYESTVRIRRNAGPYGPLPVVLALADGSSIPKVWHGRDPFVEYRVTAPSPVIWAAVDPQRTNVLDNKGINNFMRTDLNPGEGIRWSLGIAKTLEAVFGALGW